MATGTGSNEREKEVKRCYSPSKADSRDTLIPSWFFLLMGPLSSQIVQPDNDQVFTVERLWVTVVIQTVTSPFKTIDQAIKFSTSEFLRTCWCPVALPQWPSLNFIILISTSFLWSTQVWVFNLCILGRYTSITKYSRSVLEAAFWHT